VTVVATLAVAAFPLQVPASMAVATAEVIAVPGMEVRLAPEPLWAPEKLAAVTAPETVKVPAGMTTFVVPVGVAMTMVPAEGL
jgi:hypothetical protein